MDMAEQAGDPALLVDAVNVGSNDSLTVGYTRLEEGIRVGA